MLPKNLLNDLLSKHSYVNEKSATQARLRKIKQR